MVKFTGTKGSNYILFTPESDQLVTSNCVYFLEEKVLIDPGNPVATPDLILKMQKYGISPLDVRIILCTHLHIDHIGAYWLFPNATLFATDEEISCFLSNNRYFIVDQNVYSETIRQSLIKAVKLLTEHPYEKALFPMSKIMTRFHNFKQLSSGQNGFYVFPSHTPGSAIIVFDKTVFLGDIFSMQNMLAWIPRTLEDKISVLNAIKVYGKENLISGHDQISAGLVTRTAVSNRRPLNLPTNVEAGGNTNNKHLNCDENGRITSEYYVDKFGNRKCHTDGFYKKKILYNQIGKIHREIFFGADNSIIADSSGRYGTQYNYDEKGRWVLLTDIDKNHLLRKSDDGNYFTSVYYYTSPSVDQIAARVDFNCGKIVYIKYVVDDYIVEPEEAHDRYEKLISKLEKNLLL